MLVNENIRQTCDQSGCIISLRHPGEAGHISRGVTRGLQVYRFATKLVNVGNEGIRLADVAISTKSFLGVW